MIYHETKHGILYNGESLEVLRTLPDNSVDCCVTSPPYWGLRDYGTATWIGGDAECDHVETLNKHAGQRADRNQEGYKKQYKNTCAKCGAIRQDQQLGLERTPEEYVSNMVQLFREVRRVLKKDGTLWLNLGDSYNGSGGAGGDYNAGGIKEGQPKYKGRNIGSLKPKDLVGIPWRVAFALQADGWWLRQDIIWHKPNPMPESVTDRCTKAHEYVFLMSKSAKYHYDGEAIKEVATRDWNKSGGNIVGKGVHKRNDGYVDNGDGRDTSEVKEYRNKRSVWTVTTKPFKGAHFATFPRDLIRPMIQAGCKSGGVVLDPFMGSGTTAIEAISQGKRYIGIDLNPQYLDIAARRIENELDQLNIFTNKEIL